MKESTSGFLLSALGIIGVIIFVVIFFGGFIYIIYQEETQDARMYNKCIDTCERVFQEGKLITCIQTCNTMGGGTNQTDG